MTIRTHEESDEERAEQIKLAPPNQTLLKLAAKHRPPQSWWDDAEDPFAQQDATNG